MALRYDTRTTTFSPEGRLYQVEYALEAINKASTAIGIVASDAVILAADKMVTSKLLDQGKSKEKIYKIDGHIMCAVAGLSSDANILINHIRVLTQQHLYKYNEPMPLESLVIRMCDTKQSYTQFGGLRPFGVSFLVAGWDQYWGFQLYHSDPSGNYSGWKATAIGMNNQSAQSILKQEWNERLTCDEALALAAKVLTKTIETSNPNAEKLEFSVITKSVNHPDILVQKIISNEEVAALMKKAQEEQQVEQQRNA